MSSLPRPWVELRAESGDIYYWNQDTDEVSWDYPGTEGGYSDQNYNDNPQGYYDNPQGYYDNEPAEGYGKQNTGYGGGGYQGGGYQGGGYQGGGYQQNNSKPNYTAGRSASSYNNPTPSYNSPTPSYNSPTPSYSNNTPSYNSPTPSYNNNTGYGRGGGGISSYIPAVPTQILAPNLALKTEGSDSGISMPTGVKKMSLNGLNYEDFANYRWDSVKATSFTGDKQGYLERYRGSWVAQWFVLKGSMLYWFKEQLEKQPEGTIPLLGSTIEEETNLKREFTIHIFVPSTRRHYALATRGSEDFTNWMGSLRRAARGY